MYDNTDSNWSHRNRHKNIKTLEANPGKHSIDLLQKTAILGTSHIIRKVLQCETWSLSGEDHRWFKRSTRMKRPVTRDKDNNNNNNTNNNNIYYSRCNHLHNKQSRSTLLNQLSGCLQCNITFLCFINVVSRKKTKSNAIILRLAAVRNVKLR
jgi:hypothetical protein